MYKIIKDGEVIATLSRLDWVRHQENGVCIRTDETAGQGVIVDGTIYGIRGGTQLPGAEQVDIIQVQDQPAAEQRVEDLEQAQAAQEAAMVEVWAAAGAFVAVATTLTDDQALAVQSLVKTWEQALAEGTRLECNTILRKDDRLYRVAQEGGVTPQAHQPPDAEGMLAVYRPIDKAHAGTLEDPIPWVYGMDCTEGLYYSHGGGTYLCKGDMIPCVWAPDTPGLWQWEAV